MKPSGPDHAIHDGASTGNGSRECNNQVTRAFLAHMRHELRTPINAILGYSEMLLEDELEDQESLNRDLRRIHNDGSQLLSQVTGILSSSRPEHALANVDALALEIDSEMGPPLERILRSCEGLLEIPPSDEGVCSDLRRIHTAAQKLRELIGDVAELWKMTEAPGDETHLGSVIDVSSMLDECEQDDRGAETEAADEAQGGTLLIVDDNEMNRDILTRYLVRDGHEITAAQNGRQALEMIESRDFDLILLDIIMPELNGIHVLEHMKSNENLRHIPVIMISSLDEIESAVRCIEMGAEDYLPKPFNPVLLRARVGACLEKKRGRDREMKLFEQLQENYKRLQELEGLRDSLTHMIVHDLRTPLTSVIAGLQTMDLMGPLHETQKECLDISLEGGQVLLGMINDLLDISKMESGSLDLERKSFHPRSLIKRAIHQINQLVREKKLALVVNVSDDLPEIVADEEKILRTIVNLLGNAVKFTPERGAVTLSATRNDGSGQICFAVTDTGEGIPEEAFERIFEKFGQVESRKSGRKMSTGLGLTFCKMAVEAHGGRLWIESILGQGSTFRFTIPVELPSQLPA